MKKNEINEQISSQAPSSQLTTVDVQTTFITQFGNPVLGTEDKSLYYVVIRKGTKKVIIGIGQKNHDALVKLLEEI